MSTMSKLSMKVLAVGAILALSSTLSPVAAQSCTGSAVLRSDPGEPKLYVLVCNGAVCCMHVQTGSWFSCSCTGSEPTCCHMEVSMDHSMKMAEGECGSPCDAGTTCKPATGGNTTIAICITI